MKKARLPQLLAALVLLLLAAGCGAGAAGDEAAPPTDLRGPALLLFYTDN